MVFFRSPRLWVSPSAEMWDRCLYITKGGNKISYKTPNRWVYTWYADTPVKVDFRCSSRDEEKKIDVIKISVGTSWGNNYYTTFIPDSEGYLEPYAGHVTKQLRNRRFKFRKKRMFTRNKPRDYRRMERSLGKVLKSPSFREQFRNLFSRGEITDEMFSDNMVKYLGLGEGGDTLGCGKSGELKEALQS